MKNLNIQIRESKMMMIIIIFGFFVLCSKVYSQPCTVTNISPPNGGILFTPSPTLSWNISGGVSCAGCNLYESIGLIIATDSLCTNAAYYWSNGYTTSHTIPGNILQSNITSWWRISYNATCAIGFHWCSTPCSVSGPVFNFSLRLSPYAPTNLTATAQSSSVINLNWLQDTLIDETGFEIHRYNEGGSWIIRDSSSENILSYQDTGLTGNRIYFYRVRAYNSIGYSPFSNIANDTTFNPIGIIRINNEISNDFKLYNNYPNPFNPSTKIKFALHGFSFVKLAIYDLLGREVEILVNEELNAGTYAIHWDADKEPSGIYYYQMTATSDGSKVADFQSVKKMVLTK